MFAQLPVTLHLAEREFVQLLLVPQHFAVVAAGKLQSRQIGARFHQFRIAATHLQPRIRLVQLHQHVAGGDAIAGAYSQRGDGGGNQRRQAGAVRRFDSPIEVGLWRVGS